MKTDPSNPYAPPKSLEHEQDLLLEDPNAAWRDGKTLMVRKGAVLPDRCLKCDAPAEGYQISRTLYWHHSGWLLLFVVSWPLYVLVYFLVRWPGKVTVGLCPRHRRKRAWTIALGWLVALAGIGMCIAAAVWGNSKDDWVPVAIVLGIVFMLLGLIGGFIGASVLRPGRIDKNFIWLTRVSPEYLKTFPDSNRLS